MKKWWLPAFDSAASGHLVIASNLQRFLMNGYASWFVEQAVLAARMVVSKSVGHPTHTVAELQRQIHEDLRRQHPEWIEPGGESPMCDFYEARLRRLLETCARSGPAEAT